MGPLNADRGKPQSEMPRENTHYYGEATSLPVLGCGSKERESLTSKGDYFETVDGY